MYGQTLFSPAEKAGDAARVERPAPPPDTEEPYWLMEKKEAGRPYFQAEKKTEAAPYWLIGRDGGVLPPYWRAEEEKEAPPYWLAGKPEPEPAPPPERPGPPPESGGRIISYYMYQDERGVKHLTDAPTDPRYRLFTAEVRILRGLAPRHARFTHESLKPYIMEAAAIYELSPALIAAVIKSESAFDARAVSWAGAQGLMQLMPQTALDMGCLNPFDPRQNILGGSRYLRLMLDRFGGDMTLATAAYNAGPERVAKNFKVPDIPETKNYVVIVRRNYEQYLGSF